MTTHAATETSDLACGTWTRLSAPVPPRETASHDYFLGTSAIFADAATISKAEEIISNDAPGPAALRHVDWELAPFTAPTAISTTAAPTGAPMSWSMKASTTAPWVPAPTGTAIRSTTKDATVRWP